VLRKAQQLRWLWGQWKHPDKPWCNFEIQVDDTEEALFTAATKVTVHNGRPMKFWTLHSAQGNFLASMFPTLFKHSRRKNRTIVEAMAGDTWIKDLMHNVNHDIVADYIKLWMVIDGLSFDPFETRSDEIGWSWTTSGEHGKDSLSHVVPRQHWVQLQGTDMASVGAIAVQVLHLVDALESSVDS
jgi:hypothetical protein